MAIALITGGSHGLGRALTGTLHDLGWTVVIDGRDPAALETVAHELEPSGGDAPNGSARRLVTVAGDVRDPTHRAALVEAATQAGGADGIDLLVNNASTIGPSPMPALADYPLDAWRDVYEVNVVAPLALIQLALPALHRAKGRIVNVSSDAGVEGYEGWGGYGSSKAALDHLGRILAAEQPDLDVYSVDPGDMRTALHQAAFPGENISDRPEPEVSVPGILALVLGELPSGRYVARDVAVVTS
jgi:NAD(P)-dependent dehydrogenase (short-subunit alcohol dehydrogenase family)